jgi:hypothetical protein
MPKDEIMEEIKRTLKELAESQKRTDQEIAKLAESQKRTDREITKLAESQKKTDQEIAKLVESQKRTDREIEELSKEVKKVNKMVGELTDGWGKFVEGLVEPSTVELASKRGIKIKRVSRRVEAKKGRRKIEADIIIEGQKNKKGVLLVVEAKSHFESDDMEYFFSWFLDFYEFFDIYKDYEVMGVVTSPRFGNGGDKYAQKKGLWVLVPSGEVMKVINPKGFKPKVLMYQNRS